MRFIVILLFWLFFNGRATPEVFLIGIVISFLISFVTYRAGSKKSFRLDASISGFILKRLEYYFFLLTEIVKANIAVMDIILTPSKIDVNPEIIRIKTKIKDKDLNTLLANSITLTPGTITAMIRENELDVLVLDQSFGKDLENLPFIKKLEKMDETESEESL